MSKLIRSIGRTLLNSYGADLYENKDGSATIRFTKNYHDLPLNTRRKFRSLDKAEEFIDSKRGGNAIGTLSNILDTLDDKY